VIAKSTSNEIIDKFPKVGVLLSQNVNFHIDFNHFV